MIPKYWLYLNGYSAALRFQRKKNLIEVGILRSDNLETKKHLQFILTAIEEEEAFNKMTRKYVKQKQRFWFQIPCRDEIMWDNFMMEIRKYFRVIKTESFERAMR